MTYSDALAFQAGCFAIASVAVAVCIYSLLKWQAREALERIAARPRRAKGGPLMSNEETWEDRYKRAVARFAEVPEEVPLADIRIDVYGEEGYAYSSWTFADPSIRVEVRWPGKHKTIEGPEAVARLIESFLSPTEAHR